MKTSLQLLAVVFLVAASLPTAFAQSPAGRASLDKPADPRLADQRVVQIEEPPTDGRVSLATPVPNIVRAWIESPAGQPPNFLKWAFNKDATQIELLLPQSDVAGRKTIHLLTAEQSARQESGVIVLSALDATVIGKKAQLETHPGNHRIGFWILGGDYVSWTLETDIPVGKYDAELVYSRAGASGAEAAVTVGEATLSAKLASTGSWYVYQVQPLGEIELPPTATLKANVKSTRQIGPVMNLKAVVLHPVAN